MRAVAAFTSGLVFGLGLLLAGMTDPARVQGFLDVFGSWDPTLAFVMVGAICTGLLPFAWANRRDTSLLGMSMELPSGRKPDSRLVAGAAIFGIGWGLAGLCPGPAVVNLAVFRFETWLFVIAMLAGMLLHARTVRRASRN
ncbi:MAG TPA: DUF6691 family protein [Methylophilaceae bacterium]|jgi:uncharacterized membrane protein YedE/YeeE